MGFQKSFSKQINELVEQIIAGYRPQKMILFGSQLQGKADKHSDVDLLIIKDTTTRRTRRREEALLDVQRSIPVDLIIVTPEEMEILLKNQAPFITEIVEKGTVVYDAG